MVRLAAALGLAAMAFLCGSAAAQESGPVLRPPSPVTVTLNGEPFAFPDIQPAVEGGHVFLPLRPLVAPLGARDLRWDAATQTASLTSRGRLYRLKVGRTWATTGRAAIPVEQAPILRQGRLLVSLDAVRQVLGAEATWRPDERVVAITTPAPAAEEGTK